MTHCVAWPSCHLLRNWVGLNLQSGDEHSKNNIADKRLVCLDHQVWGAFTFHALSIDNLHLKEIRSDAALIKSQWKWHCEVYTKNYKRWLLTKRGENEKWRNDAHSSVQIKKLSLKKPEIPPFTRLLHCNYLTWCDSISLKARFIWSKDI